MSEIDAMNDMGDTGRGAPEDEATESETLEVALTFSYEPEALTDDLFGVSEETLFEAFELALDAVHIERSVEVSVLISTNEGVRALNRDYRGKDESTDVLSFPLLDEPLVEAPAEELWQAAADGEGDDITDGEDDEDGDLDNEAEDGDFEDGDFEDGDFEDADDDDSADEDDEDEWPLHLGDIAIARETVIRQAERAGHSPAYEAAFLLVHGVLHLVGYDDHTEAGYRAMVAIQEAVLARAGIAR
jgi:probable rRNA maturation factor